MYSSVNIKGRHSRALLMLQIAMFFLVQGRFGSQQVDVDELRDSEDGTTALGEMVESLLDDLLEKVDASLDRARAEIKAQPSGATAVGAAAAETAAPGASLVAGGGTWVAALYCAAGRAIRVRGIRCAYSLCLGSVLAYSAAAACSLCFPATWKMAFTIVV